jgi:predicted dehydrogenase
VNIRFANDTFAVVTFAQRTEPAWIGKWYYRFTIPGEVNSEVVNYRRATIRPDTGHDYYDRDAYHSGHLRELEIFADCLLNGTPMPITAHDGLRVNAMIDAICESYRTGRETKVDV